MVPHDPIGHCPLFQGLEGEARAYALAYFQAAEKSYDKGAFLHHVSFPLPRFGLVLAGTVEVSMDDMDGRHLIHPGGHVPVGLLLPLAGEGKGAPVVCLLGNAFP